MALALRARRKDRFHKIALTETAFALRAGQLLFQKEVGQRVPAKWGIFPLLPIRGGNPEETLPVSTGFQVPFETAIGPFGLQIRVGPVGLSRRQVSALQTGKTSNVAVMPRCGVRSRSGHGESKAL
jgi:hypothetical protein